MFNSLGYLAPGFHDWTYDEIKKNLVDSFPNSSRREIIFHGYSKLRNDIIQLVDTVEQWLDGSYVTNKINPGDIDLVSLIDKDKVDCLAPDKQDQLKKLFAGPDTKLTHHCDSYFVPKVPDNHPHKSSIDEALAYWENWFGTDRNGLPKGKVRTTVTSLE
jgi:hypothetical protein